MTRQLVLIEWDDSKQPTSSWQWITDYSEGPVTAVRCVSVGWMIYDGEDCKALAPNMGDVFREDAVQVSGVIRIPARCIVRITTLREPRRCRP